MSKHSNISIFVPHIGCPHLCSFCDQHVISGAQNAPTAQNVKETCEKALSEVKSPENTEIAFFGGSFTAIPRDYMIGLLSATHEFVGEGKLHGIRISTRPDYIDDEVLDILRAHGVTSIELGAQSMRDSVLTANSRGHNAQDVIHASRLIKSHGFELGLQMMVGLYGSSEEDEQYTFDEIIALQPDTLRIYPVVILAGTQLGELYKSGEYKPFDFDVAVDLCSDFMEKAEQIGIRVIKVGLHASEFVEGEMLGGFYHPAFRELCEGRSYRRAFEEQLSGGYIYGEFSVPEKCYSKAIGHKKSNIEYFKNKGIELRIISDRAQQEKSRLIERR